MGTALMAVLVLACDVKPDPAPPIKPLFTMPPKTTAQPMVTGPTPTVAFQPFFDWVATNTAAPQKGVLAKGQSCCLDDPTDIYFGTCSGATYPTPQTMRTAYWYKTTPKAFMFESEWFQFSKKPDCIDLKAIPLRSWRTAYQIAHRCRVDVGPLQGTELFIRHATQAPDSYVRVTSPEYLALNRHWRDVLDHQGLPGYEHLN